MRLPRLLTFDAMGAVLAKAVGVSADKGLAVLSVNRPEAMAAVVTRCGHVILLRPKAGRVILVLSSGLPPWRCCWQEASGAASPESLSPEGAARHADLLRR